MKIRQMLLLSTLLVAAGCAKDFPGGVTGLGESGMIPLNIEGRISRTATKATAEGFVDKDAIGLFAVNYSEGNTVPGTLAVEGNQADNAKYVFDADNHKWAPVKPVYYKDINTHVDLYVYYPYQASFTSVTEGGFEVCKDQSTEASATSLSGYEASDLLWGKAVNVTPSESSVSISLRHRLAAVKVTLVEADNSGFGDGEFESLEKSILLTGTTRKAQFDYSTGQVTSVGTAQLDGIVMCPQGDGSWRAIAIPQTVAASTQLFAITVNGVSYRFSQTSAVTYQSGKQTDFTITVSKKSPSGEYEFALADVQINDWTEDKNTHGGEARQYFVVNVTEPGTLGKTIKAMGKNPDKIRNLKVVGNVRDDDFYFMRDSMAILEAVNMKESVIAAPKEQKTLVSISTTSDVYRWYCEAFGEPDEISGTDAYWYDKGNNIPAYAFKSKTTLCYFSFPENVTIIGANSFFSTKLSGALVVPDGVSAIMPGAFAQTNIGSVSFPSNLGYICNGAFSDCSSLSGTLNLPAQLLFIGSNVFDNCQFTGELHLPDNLEYIGSSAFYYAGRFVGSLRIPDKITTLQRWIFYGCGFSGTLDLNNVIEMESCTFKYCNFSGELIIPEGVKIIPEDFLYRLSQTGYLTSVRFPSTLKEISENAFQNNPGLCCDITLPEGLQIIKKNAFYYCRNITGIELPSTIQTIQEGAFMGDYNVSRIFCKAVEPPTAIKSAFSSIAKNITVEVPAQSVKKYQADPVWGEFQRITAHYDFSLSRDKMRALNGEMTRTFTLRAPAGFSWSIESKPDWVTVSQESGTGKADITVTVSAMERTDEKFEVNEGAYNNPDYKRYKGRSGEIVFKLDDKDYTCSLEIEQYDYDYADGYVKTHHEATQGNGIDIIFIGDGYDARDIASGIFVSNADEAYNAFFDLEPYKTYKDYFNVYSVMSMSDESGIGTVNTIRDTKFGTYFTQNRIMIPDAEPMFEWAKKADNGVDFTKALVVNLMNTSTYEGICAMYGDGSAIAFCPVSRDAYPYDFRGIVQHEAGGHGFGKLGDEYIYHNAFIQTCNCPCCDHGTEFNAMKEKGWYRNLSMSGDANQVPWAHLIYHSKYSDYVDMYEGGYMHSRGVYRSEATSCMINNIPYYSAISRQAIVERIMEIAGEEFTLEDFYSNDSDAFGSQTKAGFAMPFDRTFGIDPKWSRGSEKGSVVYMGEHPDYSKIK
ncbi:MAG: leucine-rich repeat protein [Bacteroidaceae bacterium]|nr:leucine-rich repeat protein [Bacteroidaceae bacterium]